MQTFLPYESFFTSAGVLDKRRLNKQRIEAWQIFLAITDSTYGWQNHPAVNMWRGYERWLLQYGHEICLQCNVLKIADNVGWLNRFSNEMAKRGFKEMEKDKPFWLGRTDFHLSHQSNLLRKDPIYYGQFFRDVPNNLPYIWPSRIDQIKVRMGYQ